MHQIRHFLPVQIVANEELYNLVRATLIAHGTNLNRWCEAHDINRQTVDKALKGQRIGRNAQTLRDQIVAELFPKSGRAA